ncbi:unnamed protein product, partial [marine sediment metagenome]
DLNMLGAYKRGSEIRAIGTEYQYSAKIIDNAKFPSSGANVNYFFGIENSALQNKYEIIYKRERIKMINLGLAPDEAAAAATRLTSLQHTHEAVEAFAKKYGVEYKRWLNK